MATKLRQTNPARGKKAPDYADSLYMIRDSVQRRSALIYGKLDGERFGEHCAIGSFFADNPQLALNCDIIDEVAAYNDSIPPNASNRVRRNKVLRWLNWKLQVLAGKAKGPMPT